MADAASLTLNWTDNANNENGFNIERKTGTTGIFAQLATVGSNITSYTDSNVAAGTTYCYRVDAFNSTVISPYSNEVCATTASSQTFSLTTTKAGTGSGTVTSSPGGISCGATCTASYNSGQVVTLTATPASGSTFAGWSGNADCSDGSVTMNSSMSCTATFNAQQQQFTLSVSKAGTGSGTVTSSPTGINCGAICAAGYNSGQVVILTATASGGSNFAGWNGGNCGGTGTCLVTVNANTAVTATFNPQLPSITISDVIVTEGNTGTTNAIYTVNLSAASSQTVTVTYNTTNGTATAGSDYVAKSGNITFNAGETSKAITVLVNGDTIVEPNETFFVNLISATNATIGKGQGVGTIVNDDSIVVKNKTADFDGDGRTDIAVYRNGAWYILRSSDGGVTATGFGGLAEDIPVPADYDGDGKTDIAVYRNGAWYILRSSDGGVTATGFGGLAQDVPVPADYDGDGKADIAVYRNGAWYILRSSDGGVTATGFGGLPQDIPVPADYDGDGKTDIAVYRNGAWFILRSSDGGVTATGFGGLPQDVPVPADYDGDGKTDIAVYRTGAWYILRSSDGGVTATGFGGLPQDIPLN
jgi:hypothetical protein